MAVSPVEVMLELTPRARFEAISIGTFQALSQNPELVVATGMLILGGTFASLLFTNKKKQR